MTPHDSGDRDDTTDRFETARHQMVVEQIAARGVRDARVLAAMERVPRHRFIPDDELAAAYADHPLPIGLGQTISQPYIVALMIEALAAESGSRVLEVGAGCGYVSAILAEMGCEVYAMEILEILADETRERLRTLGYKRVHLRCADGWRGWPEAAPFDGIIVSAAPETVPPVLFEQLAEAGRLVIPVGVEHQELWLYRRTAGGFRGEQLCDVRFVRMTSASG